MNSNHDKFIQELMSRSKKAYKKEEKLEVTAKTKFTEYQQGSIRAFEIVEEEYNKMKEELVDLESIKSYLQESAGSACRDPEFLELEIAKYKRRCDMLNTIVLKMMFEKYGLE